MSRYYWSAPGSALIAGEYRIIEEGGIGVAVACGGRATMSFKNSPIPDFRGIWPGKHESEVSDSLLADIVRETLSGRFGEYPIPSISVVVDTSPFFDNLGRKRGFGSSAAATLLLAKSMAPDAALEDLALAAVDAHRVFQGGRGSGYDILTSARGGAGLFTGGRHPVWDSLEWPKDIESWLLKGPSPVQTPAAVTQYQIWKADYPDEYRTLTAEMDAAIGELQSAGDGDSTLWINQIKKLAHIGFNLGNRIGVPARPHDFGGLGRDIVSGDRNGAALKCLGAGDELVLLIAESGVLRKTEKQLLLEMELVGKAERLIVDTDGLRNDS